jgi:digeranylgeranylglycerophospholipid reductase
MEPDYDVVIAGGGPAGCIAGTVAARGGLRVLLVDRNPQPAVGKKTTWGWTCGDAVGKHHLDFIRRELRLSYGSPEIENPVDGVYAFTPDLETKLPFEGAGYVLDRHHFALRLLKDATGAGVQFRGEILVAGPLHDDGKITGIYGQDVTTRKPFKVTGKIIVDALGVSSILRRRLPDGTWVDREVDLDDIEPTGRYIMRFNSEQLDERYFDPKYCLIHLNQLLAPGGYGWVFPKGKDKINVGLGIQKKTLERQNAAMKRDENLQTLIDSYIRWNPLLRDAKIVNDDYNGVGNWSVPVRRQMDCMVADGYMGVGDSICAPNPISAGGIGPALVGGFYAGKVAVEAIQSKDTSLSGLWDYNVKYMEHYGKKTPALEAFRIYLQTLSNEQINYGMRHFISTEEATMLSVGEIPKISTASKLRKAIRGLGNMKAFKGLVYAVGKMKELNAHFENYPKTPAEFLEWKRKTDLILSQVREHFAAS